MLLVVVMHRKSLVTVFDATSQQELPRAFLVSLCASFVNNRLPKKLWERNIFSRVCPLLCSKEEGRSHLANTSDALDLTIHWPPCAPVMPPSPVQRPPLALPTPAQLTLPTCSNEVHTVAKRVVGTLLECFHVIFNYHFPKCSNHLNLVRLW